MPPQVNIHGGINLKGRCAEIDNMVLAVEASNTKAADSGNLWLNSSRKRITYVESGAKENSNLILRELAHIDDVAGMSSKIEQHFHGTITPQSGVTKTAFDNTVPLATEGTQIWQQTVTPVSLENAVRITFSGMVDTSTNDGAVTIAIFEGSRLIGFTVTGSSSYNGNVPATFLLDLYDPVANLTPKTYSCRIGINKGTWYVGRPRLYTMGGGSSSFWVIREEKP